MSKQWRQTIYFGKSLPKYHWEIIFSLGINKCRGIKTIILSTNAIALLKYFFCYEYLVTEFQCIRWSTFKKSEDSRIGNSFQRDTLFSKTRWKASHI